MASGTPNSPELLAAYDEQDCRETVSNFKVACIIGMILMPAGVILDVIQGFFQAGWSRQTAPPPTSGSDSPPAAGGA